VHVIPELSWGGEGSPRVPRGVDGKNAEDESMGVGRWDDDVEGYGVPCKPRRNRHTLTVQVVLDSSNNAPFKGAGGSGQSH